MSKPNGYTHPYHDDAVTLFALAQEAEYFSEHIYVPPEEIEKFKKRKNARYLRAAELGLPDAQCKVGRLIQAREIESGDIDAKQWFQKAADQGHLPAVLELAYHYEHSETETNKAKAFLLYADAICKAVSIHNDEGVIFSAYGYLMDLLPKGNRPEISEEGVLKLEWDDGTQAELDLVSLAKSVRPAPAVVAVDGEPTPPAP